jgi:hypothetical protein
LVPHGLPPCAICNSTIVQNTKRSCRRDLRRLIFPKRTNPSIQFAILAIPIAHLTRSFRMWLQAGTMVLRSIQFHADSLLGKPGRITRPLPSWMSQCENALVICVTDQFARESLFIDRPIDPKPL